MELARNLYRRGLPRRAITFVEKLNGASQPVVVMVSGASLYVVKFRDFTGKFGLMAEVIGAELMAAMGLPSPPWHPIEFTDSFLDAHPELWYRTQDGGKTIRPSAGLHFGTRLVLSDGMNPTFVGLPSTWTSRILNIEEFVGALLIDLWTNNCDRRQALFLCDGQASKLRALFIDNDHMLGGYFGDENTCPRRLMASTTAIYRSCWRPEVVSRWETVIEDIGEPWLDRMIDRIPREWADRSARQHARSVLQARRRILKHLISDVDEALKTLKNAEIHTPIPAMAVRGHVNQTGYPEPQESMGE
jgi:hypothetical protein